MSNKYIIKYNKNLMIGGMNNNLISGFIKEINSIYAHIRLLYSHGDIIVLSGSCAVIYYLYTYGYTDLIDLIPEPYDINFLLLTDDPNATITIPFIGDHKRKQETYGQSAIFQNDWIPHLKFKSFNLSIGKKSISYNQVGQINLLSLSQLKVYLSKNTKIIEIIDKIKLKKLT